MTPEHGSIDLSAAAMMFADLLKATHLSRPSDVATLLGDHAAAVGVVDLVLYLADYEQAHLIPVPSKYAADRAVMAIEGTVAGRVFASSTILEVDAGPAGYRRVWLPLLDGTDRLGVVEMTVPATAGRVDVERVAILERYAHMAAQLIIVKSAYGDVFEFVRRRRPMSIAAELQWKLLPPLVFATSGLVLAGIIEPAYSAGGDTFDYAVNDSVAELAVFDAMGHGMQAALAVAVAVSAYRNSRRRLLNLTDTYTAIDVAMTEQFHGDRYATAVLAQLEIDTGKLSWISAGHLPPLLLRGGKLVKLLKSAPSTPLGVPFGDQITVGQESLEPGDRVLLYTDGLTEARTPTGEFFTGERLAEFFEREAAAGRPAPETLRRLRHAILGYQDGHLQDDATALLVDWRADTEQQLMPQTV